jgi:hypothetical protein
MLTTANRTHSTNVGIALMRNEHLLGSDFELKCIQFPQNISISEEDQMRRRIPVVCILALSLTLVLGSGLYAQLKQEGDTGLDRVSGLVQEIDKEKSTMTLLQKDTVGKFWWVAFNDKTTVTLKNQPGKIADLKNAMHVIVLGKFDKAKYILNASRIDIRDQK